MDYNIPAAARNASFTSQTTLEEIYEQGAEWMKYEICDKLLCIKGEMESIIESAETADADELKHALGNIVNEIDEIIN